MLWNLVSPAYAPILLNKDAGVPAWVLNGAALDLNFATGRGFNSMSRSKLTPDSILTYTSPSPKMVYGTDGVLRYAPHNLLSYSEQFDDAAWVKFGSSTTSNAAIAPDGTLTADKVAETEATSAHTVTQSPTVIGGATYTYSVYLKAGELNYALVGVSTTGFPFAVISVNLLTGGVSTGTGSPLNAFAENVGNGWWRVGFSIVATGSSTGQCIVYLSQDGVFANRAHTGILGAGIYIWGAQLSLGPSALTYVPTTSAARYSLPIDHNPTTFDPLGVLIEEQRTNLLIYSEQFDNAAWTKASGTITANNATAPDGTVTADSMVPSGGASITQTATITANGTYTVSLFIKPNTLSWCRLLIFETAASANRITAWANLATGTIGTVAAGGTGSGASAELEELSDGWFRLSLTGAVNNSATGITVYFGATTGDNTTTGASTTYSVWGAQLEAGAFPTSYIPTVASQVTRAADKISILTSAFAYGASNTLLTTADIHVKSANALAQLDDGTLNNRMTCWADSGPNPQAAVRTANVAQAAVTIGSVSLNTEFNIAFAFAENDVTGAVDGALAASPDTSCNLPTTTTLRVGSRVSDGYLNGHIKRLTYFPMRKTDAQLQELTA